jgi:tetratricopeptide (TPR) repeat protein
MNNHRMNKFFCAAFIVGFQSTAQAALAAEASASKAQPISPTVNSDGDTERVRTLFREGNAHMLAGEYEAARRSLLQAWALRQSSDIAGALGQVELAMKRYRDAAEHLQWCLAHFPPVESEKTLEATRLLFDVAMRAVAQLRISVNHEGASILVDGKVVGTSPMSAPVFVDPGPHQVEAQYRGINDVRTIATDAGNDYGIDFSLTPGDSATRKPISNSQATRGVAQPEAAAAARTNSAPSGRSVVPVIVGGAVFAVAIGTGIALLDSSSSSYDDARAVQNQVGPAGCVNNAKNQSLCAELKSSTETGDSREKWAIAAFATAGAALVAVPVFWFWPREKPVDNSARAEWRIRGSVAPHYSGLSLVGDF